MTSSPRYTPEQLGPYPDGSFWWVVRDHHAGIPESDQHGNLLRWPDRDGADRWIDKQTPGGRR